MSLKDKLLIGLGEDINNYIYYGGDFDSHLHQVVKTEWFTVLDRSLIRNLGIKIVLHCLSVVKPIILALSQLVVPVLAFEQLID